MMRHIVVAALLFAGSILPAQTVTTYRKTSTAEVAQRTYDRLFTGIALDSTRGVAALSRVRKCLTDSYAVDQFQSDFRAKLVALADARNSDLRALLWTSVDSVRFDLNARGVDARLNPSPTRTR
jgi:hypothetical protein